MSCYTFPIQVAWYPGVIARLGTGITSVIERPRWGGQAGGKAQGQAEGGEGPDRGRRRARQRAAEGQTEGGGGPDRAAEGEVERDEVVS